MSDTSNNLDNASTETSVSPSIGAPFSDETPALFQSFEESGGEDLSPEQLTQLLELSPSNPLSQSGMTSEELITMFEGFESGSNSVEGAPSFAAAFGSGESGAIAPPAETSGESAIAPSSTSASGGFSTEEANALLLQSPFAPLAGVVGEDNLTSIFDNVGAPGSNPFAGGSGSTSGGNPFAGGSGGASGGNPFSGSSGGMSGGNPFAGGSGGASGGNPFSGSSGGMSGGNPFAGGSGEGGESSPPAEGVGGSSGSSSDDLNQQLRQSPFGRLTEVLGDDLSSIFSGVSGGGEGENPFGGAAPGGSGSNADLPYGGNPFAGDNFNTIFGGGASSGGGSNPFAGGSGDADGTGSTGGSNPFAGGANGGNPFAGGTSVGSSGGGSNPFTGGSSGGNPFASGGGSNPFTGGSSGGNPFAGDSGGSGGSNPFAGGSGGGSNPFAGGTGGSNPFVGGAEGEGSVGGSSSSNPFAGGSGGNPFAGGSGNPFLDGMSLVSESDELLSVEGDSRLTIRGVNLITTDAANDIGGSSGSGAPISDGSNNQTDFAGINNIVLGNGVQFGVGNDIEFEVESASGSSPMSEPATEVEASPYVYDFSGNGGSTTGGSALIGGSNNDNYFAGINNLLMGTDIQFAVGDDINYEITSKNPSDSKTVLGGSNNRNYFAGINNLILGSDISFAVGEDLNIKIDRTTSSSASLVPSGGTSSITQSSGNGDRQMFQGIDTLLMGTSQDEILNGGAGAMLIGGDGEDDFLIATGGMPEAPSTIADFEVGADVIRISRVPGVSQFSDVSLTAEENGTMISFGEQNMAFLSGISTNDLSSSSFAINPV
jgi:hypothetical protein